jgi:hypothetical protein
VTNIRALLCAVGVVLTSGCGSSDTPEQVAPKTTTEHGSYAQCLAEHGVDTPPAPALGPAPGPAAAPPGVDETTWQQAVQACTELAPGPAGS